ncbi:MAG: N-acetylmuramoyl-L-alanine amidase [Bacteroidales bacterium]|nr:N-acetylmuramoyl-L-alanine amidase [Bacteroidales bacterium]
MKRIALFFGIFCALLFLPQEGVSQQKLRKVVIDAGHGGKDPGAVGRYTKEKDIALAIALKTGNYIEKNLPDVEVIYTRTTDVFVELHRRAQIANQSEADMFISIHCNANNSSRPYGTETYVMGLHKSQANLEVAKLENAVLLKEEDYSDMYDGFDPNRDEDYITLTLFQNAYLENSLSLASLVQDQFRERVRLKDRGVWQAGFWVLYKTAMPGILIETGFLSNPNDERFLRSEEGQVYIASAIYRAFKEYKLRFEDPANRAKMASQVTQAKAGTENIRFRVQFASSSREKPLDKFKDVEQVRVYKHNGMFKYTSGDETTYGAAVQIQNKLRLNRKYRDAFIVAFRDEERINLDTARELKPD